MAFQTTKGKLVWSSTSSKWAYNDGSTIATTLATAVSIAAASNIMIDGSKSTNTVFSLTAGTNGSHNVKATLVGGAGNDILAVNTSAGTNLAWFNGGAGDDVITGGKGQDTFEFTGSFGTDTVNSVGLNSQQDTIKLGTTFANLSFNNFSTATTLTVSANGLGDVLLKFDSGDVADMEAEAKFITTDKTFFVQAANTSAATTFTATGASVEYIRQYGSGPSTFKSGGKYDTLIGGSGDDTFAYNKDIAVINGGSDGKDVVLLDTNLTTTQTIDLTSAKFTSIEVATVTSKAGTAGQVLRGLTTADTLNGGVGADSIWSRGGNDQLSGGAGVDTFWFAAGDGVDTITDITAVTKDVLKFVGVNQADLSYAFDTSASTSLIITYGTSGSDMVFVKNLNTVKPVTVQTNDKTFGLIAQSFAYNAVAATTLAGSTGADYIRNFFTGDVTATTVLTFDGKGGADTLIGGTGKDKFVYSANLAYVDGGAGSDTLDASASVSAVTIDLYANAARFANVEKVVGGSGNDVLRGYSAASETLDGGVGADALWSAGGDDSLIGGAGNDTYWFAAGDGNDSLMVNSTDKDVYKFIGVNMADLTFAKDVDTATKLKVTYGSDTVTIENYNVVNAMTAESFQTADATFHLITDQAGAANMTGSAGADLIKVFGDDAATIVGSGGADTIYGGTGDDIITFRSDLVSVDGGAGVNKFVSGTGYSPLTIDLQLAKYTNIQQVDGANGNDVIRGTAGAQTLAGGAGNDALWGAAGDDQLTGGAGVDTYWFTAGDGIDTITAPNGSEDVSDVVKFYSVAGTANVTAALDGSDLNLTLTDGSKLVLQSWSGTNKINKFTFDSGTYKLSDDAATWTKLS